MNNSSSKPCIAVMAKLPEKGKVKTRLAVSLGDDRTLHIYKTILSRLHSLLLSLDTEVHIHYTGDIEIPNDFFPGFRKIPQIEADLGMRMQSAMETSMELSGRAVVLTGSDIPDLTTEVFHRSFELLERNEVVIGPSEDGGYYLLASANVYPQLFSGINWSTETVRAETLAKCVRLDLKVGFTPELNDIDTFEDLKHSAFWLEERNNI